MLYFAARLGALLSLFALAACDGVPAQPDTWQADYEAQQRERGAAAVADCVAVRCSTLNLDATLIADFTVLNEMTHVTVLMASSTNLDDLADISGMTQLTELHVSYTQLASLDGLGAFPNLELLHAEALVDVDDYAPIGQLSKLRELAVTAVGDDPLGYVPQLTRLETLIVQTGNIPDLGPLENHPALRDVSLLAGLPADDAVLLSLPRLRSVHFHTWAVSDDTRAALIARGIRIDDEPEVLC